MRSSINIPTLTQPSYEPFDTELVQFEKDGEVGIYLADIGKILIIHSDRGHDIGELIVLGDVNDIYFDKIQKFNGTVTLEND